MKRRAALALGAAWGLAPLRPARAAPRLAVDAFPPVDEAPSRPDFLAFRGRLQAALRRHDAAAVRAVLHPDIKLSFGGDHGPADFERLWTPDAPGSPLWSTLGALLNLGGSFDVAGAFVAPYVHSRWPERFDPFEHAAVTGHGVGVRSRPGLDAPVVGRLDPSIVALVAPPRDVAGWTAIRGPDVRPAWVASAWLRSPLAHRAMFARGARDWRMTLLLAGD